jgi:hypothetical protein
MKSLPYKECTEAAQEFAKKGVLIRQRWVCAGCGAEVLANRFNYWTENGHHEDCGHITNLVEQGCGFIVFMEE